MRAITFLNILLALAMGEALAASRIVLRVPEMAGADREELVTSGVPLPRGALQDETRCRLLDEKENELPFAGTVLARWPDGSVKWLLLDFHASLSAGETKRFVLECGRPSTTKLQPPFVRITTKPGNVFEVTTGPLRFHVSRERYTFLNAAWIDKDGDGAFSEKEAIIIPGQGESIYEIETTPPGPPQEENWLRDAAGGPRERFKAEVSDARVEFHHPLRAVVLVRGEYRDEKGRSIGPFWTRYTAWAGSTTIGVEHFFAFDADVEKAFLRALSLGLRLEGQTPLNTTFGLEEKKFIRAEPTLSETTLVEVMPDRFYHLVPLSVDRRVRYQVIGKSEDGAEQVLKEGVEATGWVTLESERGTLTIALRDFPRLHPKEIWVEPARHAFRYYLWPERGGKVLDLRRRYKGQRIEDHYDTGEYAPAGRGFGKTHQMLIHFGAGRSDPSAALALARRANEPLRAFCSPEHYASCDVWPRFHPVDPKRFPETEACIRVGVELMLRLPRLFHWDGIVDWGDTLFNGYEHAPHKQVKEVPKTSWVVRGYDGWFNNDCNVAHDVMMLFLRSGDDRIYSYWERMVMHVMDVDTIHAAANPREIGGGRRHDQQHWGASYTGYGTAAVEAGELYYLTGSLWAKEMLRKYAEWYMVEGGAEWETRLPCLVLAWEATGDERYMDFIRRPAMREDVYGLAMGKPGSIDQPHFRTHAVELGVDLLYRATGEKQWLEHIVTAARRLIEKNPGNPYGRSLLAKAYLATGDREILDWLRRLMLVAEPYARAARERFFQAGRVPDDLKALSWEELVDLSRKVSVPDVRTLIYTFRYYPYVMAALVEAGLDEDGMELCDFALDRRGMGQFHLRGPDVPEPKDAHYEFISIAEVANCDPLDDPFGLYAGRESHPLKQGEIGFDFGEWGEIEPGYIPVRPATRYPYRGVLPRPREHDCTNLIGLPFGATWRINKVPFHLPDPAVAPGGRTMLVVGKGEAISIPIGRLVRKLYILGHICRTRSSWKEVGARYHLRYADGTAQTIDLVNLEDYEYAFDWGFAKRALFARNWKVQGGWDGGAPILNNYPIACEAKPLKELVIEDLGKGIGFMILAITAEIPGARPEQPVKEIFFREQGSARRRWVQGAVWGWIDPSPALEQSGYSVWSSGSATMRVALPDGLYDVELEVSGYCPFNVRVDGGLAVRGVVASRGSIPRVGSEPERIRFPARAKGGTIDITLEADRTVGNWRHPSRLQGQAWRLEGVRIFPGTREPPEPRAELVYGWMEPEIVLSQIPAEIGALSDARLKSCIRSKSPSGTFRADLPPGDYEAELLFALRGSGTREGRVRMNVFLQGKRVLSDFDGGSYTKPITHILPFRVERGGNLTLLFQPSGPDTEWGINAMIIRRK